MQNHQRFHEALAARGHRLVIANHSNRSFAEGRDHVELRRLATG